MSVFDALTRRQRAVYEHLLERHLENRPPPTQQELAEALGLVSRGSLHKHIEALTRAGLVEPTYGQRRGVRLVTPRASPAGAGKRSSSAASALVPAAWAQRADGFVPRDRPARAGRELPLLGRIAAGWPIEAVQDCELLEIPAFLYTRDDCYVLQVKGDSMIEEGIFDGDYIVVEPRDTASNGDLVVALVDGAQATVKRLLQRPEEILLIPSNASLEPMCYSPERIQIQGVVVGQMRSYR